MLMDLACIIISVIASASHIEKFIKFTEKIVFKRYLDVAQEKGKNQCYPVEAFSNHQAINDVFINPVPTAEREKKIVKKVN